MIRYFTRYSRAALLATLLSCSIALPAGAAGPAAYPSKPITIIVPYPTGGSNDTFARQVAKELGEQFKLPVIVDNKPGASGNMGTAQVAQSAPDGYKLVAVSSSMTTNAAVQARPGFDPVKDFAPVAMIAKGPFVVAVNKDFAATNPAELIATIQANPGKFNYASSGSGGVNQFATELMKSMVPGLRIEHVPYRGMAPAVTDLIGNQAQMLIASGPSLLPMVRAGKLRAIAVTSAQRSPIAPELPPMADVIPGYQFELWWGLLAPAGTPKEILATLNAAVNRALAKPELTEAFLKEGAITTPLTAEQFGAQIATDVQRWKKLAAKQNIVAD